MEWVGLEADGLEALSVLAADDGHGGFGAVCEGEGLAVPLEGLATVLGGFDGEHAGFGATEAGGEGHPEVWGVDAQGLVDPGVPVVELVVETESLTAKTEEPPLKTTPSPASWNVTFPVIVPPALGKAAEAMLRAELAVELAVLAMAVVAIRPLSRSLMAA